MPLSTARAWAENPNSQTIGLSPETWFLARKSSLSGSNPKDQMFCTGALSARFCNWTPAPSGSLTRVSRLLLIFQLPTWFQYILLLFLFLTSFHTWGWTECFLRLAAQTSEKVSWQQCGLRSIACSGTVCLLLKRKQERRRRLAEKLNKEMRFWNQTASQTKDVQDVSPTPKCRLCS